MNKAKFRQSTMTAREMRRMSEREDRHNARKAQVDAFWALSPEERARRMADNAAFQRINRNGITLEDLKKVEDQGRKDGFAMGAEETMKSCYAAVCLALHELHNFDSDACRSVLAAADEKVMYALNSNELLDEMKNEMDLEFSFNADVGEDRIREV